MYEKYRFVRSSSHLFGSLVVERVIRVCVYIFINVLFFVRFSYFSVWLYALLFPFVSVPHIRTIAWQYKRSQSKWLHFVVWYLYSSIFYNKFICVNTLLFISLIDLIQMIYMCMYTKILYNRLFCNNIQRQTKYGFMSI